MPDQKNPKGQPRDLGSSADAPGERQRATGSVSLPGGPRPTGTVSAVTGSVSRTTATSPGRVPPKAPPPKAASAINVAALMKGGVVANGATPAPAAPKQMTDHQKRMLGSAFQDTSRMNALKAVVGNTEEPRHDDDDEPTSLGKRFDGARPAPELTNRDLYKTVQAPVQSRPGRRSREIYRQVINQFAVGNNPRYTGDGPDRGRGHIFIWDVSRAMNCEVPHFTGMKELSLGQTVDWLRHEGPLQGWTRANPEDAVTTALKGMLVIAMPREIRIKQLAVVLPMQADKDGRPRLAAAGVKLGNNLSLFDALGVYSAEFLFHA